MTGRCHSDIFYILHHVAVLIISFTMLLLTIFWSFTLAPLVYQLSNTSFMWCFIVKKMVISLVLLFMIRIRFPADKSMALKTLVKEVRKFEKIDYKLRKCKLDIVFLETCLESNIIPKFLNFHVSNLQLKHHALIIPVKWNC